MQQQSQSLGGGVAAVQPKPKQRARRGQATDPHSIAERVRSNHYTSLAFSSPFLFFSFLFSKMILI